MPPIVPPSAFIFGVSWRATKQAETSVVGGIIPDYVRKLHERMPVILKEEDYEAWLTGSITPMSRR